MVKAEILVPSLHCMMVGFSMPLSPACTLASVHKDTYQVYYQCRPGPFEGSQQPCGKNGYGLPAKVSGGAEEIP